MALRLVFLHGTHLDSDAAPLRIAVAIMNMATETGRKEDQP